MQDEYSLSQKQSVFLTTLHIHRSILPKKLYFYIISSVTGFGSAVKLVRKALKGKAVFNCQLKHLIVDMCIKVLNVDI
jgi:hypothetical protein